MSSTDTKIEATKASLFFGQLLVAVLIVLGAAGFWLINPLYGWLYLAFSTFSIYIIIRRLLCNSCYYCKSCTKGFAKLSIMSLGANHIPGLSRASVLGMTAYIYAVLIVIPALIVTNAALQQFNLAHASVIAGILSVSVLSIVMRIRKGNKLITR